MKDNIPQPSGVYSRNEINHHITKLYRIYLQCGRPGFDPWVEKIP